MKTTVIDVDRVNNFVFVSSGCGFFNFRKAVGLRKGLGGNFIVVGEGGKGLGLIKPFGNYEIKETWK